MLKLNSVKMRLRVRLLTSTAVALTLSSAVAQAANEWSSTFWGGPFPIVADPLITDVTVGGTVNVNIDAAHNASITTNTGLVGNSVYNVLSAGSINSAVWGIWSSFDSTSTATIDGSVTAAGNGIAFNTVLGTVGDQTISGTGSIDAGGYGLWLVDDKGKIDVSGLVGGIIGDLNGIYAISTTGNQDYKVAGNITSSAGYGIVTSSLTGNILADGQGTSEIDAAIDGVYLNTVSATAGMGNITIQNYKKISGGNNGVTVNFGTGGTLGNVSVLNNGDITGDIRNGIETYTFGDTTITGNGVVTGAINGIAANFAWASPGDVLIDQQKNVTGGGAGSGIVVGTGTGNIDITSGGITTGGTGIWALSSLGGNVAIEVNNNVTGTTLDGILSTTTSGNQTITINSPAVVEGLVYGLVTGTSSGTATTTNFGTIQNTQDAVGASGTAGFQAVWLGTGNNILNNEAGGKVIGGITDSSTGVFNNNAGAVWTPSLLNFQNALSTNNNSGVINVRTGATVGVAVTNNLSGGLVDLTYGGTSPNATDYLYTYGYNAKGGSTTKFNVDFTAANSTGVEALANDHSSTGLGTSDTIGSIANPIPGAGAKISLVNVGTPGVATSGSLALILPAAGPAGLADPGLGGLATMIASDDYVFASDPSTAAIKFMLVEDGFGGVHLQWAPNITEESLGAYVGGSMSNPDSVGGAINGAMGGLAGVGAGFGGGPGGGGVAGSIADAAASAAGQNGTCGPSKDMLHGTYSTDSHVWMSAEGQGANYDGGGSGWNGGTALGIERDIGGNIGLGCGDVAIGMFGFIDAYSNANAAGMQEGNAKGGGLYAKAASQNGLYASVLGAVGFGDVDLTNNVFGSTAQQDSMNYLGNLTVGYSSSISDTLTMDARVFGTIGHVDGNGFTDSAGIVVDGTNATSLTIGAMVGLSANIADNTSAFINLGAKYIALSQDATAFGTSVSGTNDTVVGAIEAGIVATISESATFTATGFGDLSTDAVSYGGNLTLNFKL